MKISNDTQNELSKLGLYQVVGGAIGILMVIWLLFNTTEFPGILVLVFIIMLLFFSYSVFCGMLCLKSKSSALTHSLINQALQIIGFAIFGYAFTYVAGLYLSIGLDLTESARITFGFGISKLILNINKDIEATRVDINIVGILVFLWVDRLIKKVKQERAQRENADFI